MNTQFRLQHLVTLGAAALTAGAAQAQVASAVIREGIALPNGPATETITSITSVMANNAGGYAVRLDTTGSGTTLSHVWGAANGGPGAPLRTEGSFSGYTQTAFETFFGVSNTGQVAYSPTLTIGDSVWLDSTPVAVDPEPSTVAGFFWSFASRPLVSGLGTPYCVAGLSTTAGGSTASYAFVQGISGNVLFRSGDTLPGMPGPIGTSATPIDFDYAISANDSHYILTVKLAGATSTTDEYVIYDGSVLSVGGSPMVEGTVVPPGIGGVNGERWGTFDLFACTENGSYLITGDTDAPTTADDYLMVNGVLVHRVGDVIDGFTTVGGIQSATMNEAGSIAYVWEIVTGGGNLEALFVNDKIVLVEGDLVDLDGDGIAEPNSVLRDIGETRQLAMASNGDVYVQCQIDVNGTTTTTDDIDAIFRIPAPVSGPIVYCTAGTTTNGCVPAIAASASPSVSFANACSLSIANVEGQKSGLIFYSITGANSQPWSATSTSFLCVKSPTQRSQPQSSGGTANACDGSLTLDWNAFQTANPGSLGNPWSAGDKVYVQGWFRDPPAPKTTNLSDAVELTYLP
jgi:hypothetical protein